LYEQLQEMSDATGANLTLYGPPASSGLRTGLVAFNSPTVHATDLSFFLDQEGVAVRTGHHCCQPLHTELGAQGSMRASLYFYNSKSDVDTFVEKLQGVLAMFQDMQGGGVLEI